jgi:multiple sugar transport system substrate-binding protein
MPQDRPEAWEWLGPRCVNACTAWHTGPLPVTRRAVSATLTPATRHRDNPGPVGLRPSVAKRSEDDEEGNMADPVTPRPASSPAIASSSVTRRQVLGGLAGVAGLAAAPSLIAACSTPAATPASSGAAPSAAGSSAGGSAAVTGSTTLGSNYSNKDTDTKAMQAVVDAFTKKTNIAVKVNTVDHNTFQKQISSYLQGTPDDVFTWFAGYRMRTYANQGLAGDISDIWTKISANYSDAFKQASTGDDGKQYFIPFYNYPWVVVYRKSVFTDKGYAVPKTWTDFKSLADKMKSGGFDAPMAFADKDGWPAMGTFDILNMRLNGYKFHVDLMAGKEKWADAKVKQVFESWKELLPYLQTGALGRTWQEAATGLVNKKTGMYFLGTFAGQQATKKEDHDDLDFFPFPTLGTQFDSELGIDAPIDGFMMSAKPKNADTAKAFLEYLSTGEAQKVFLDVTPNNVAAAKDTDTSNYDAFQKKSAEIIAGSGAIAQFLDRDTKPEFADEMIKKLQAFLNDPKQDLTAFTDGIQKFWDSLA